MDIDSSNLVQMNDHSTDFGLEFVKTEPHIGINIEFIEATGTNGVTVIDQPDNVKIKSEENPLGTDIDGIGKTYQQYYCPELLKLQFGFQNLNLFSLFKVLCVTLSHFRINQSRAAGILYRTKSERLQCGRSSMWCR